MSLDSSWGWVVVAGSFCSYFVIGSIIWMYGAFLDNISGSFYVPPVLGAITHSLMTGLCLTSGNLSYGIVKEFGCQTAGFIGSISAGFAFLIASRLTNFIAFIIAIGVLGGTSMGLMCLSAAVCIGHYFDKWRPLAISVALAGTDCGILFFSFYGVATSRGYNWRAKFKLIAAALFFCSFMAMTYRKIRNVHIINNENIILENAPEEKTAEDDQEAENVSETTSTSETNRRKSKCCKVVHKRCCEVMCRKCCEVMCRRCCEVICRRCCKMFNLVALIRKAVYKYCPSKLRSALSQMINFKLLRSPSFVIIAISNFFAFLGMYNPALFLVNRIVEVDVSKNVTYTLFISFGVSRLVGRISTGILLSAFSIQPLTVFCLNCAVCSVVSIFTYLFIDVYSQHILYICIVGFSLASVTSLGIPLIADLHGIENLANGFGLLMFFQGVASFVGGPVAWVIVTQTNFYNNLILFTGWVFFLCALFSASAKKQILIPSSKST